MLAQTPSMRHRITRESLAPFTASASGNISNCNGHNNNNNIKRKYKNSHSLVAVFQSIVADFEERRPSDIAIMKVAKNNSIQHRRVYDFFNMLTSLNVCQYLVKGKLSWVGLDALERTIQDAYTNIEMETFSRHISLSSFSRSTSSSNINLTAINDGPISSIFSVGASPSLGTLAIKFLCLYLYLGVNTLFLKNVSMLFHDPRSDIKSLERRIYLVLNFLEVIGAVSHTSKAGEYKLNLPKSKEIVAMAMEAKRRSFQTHSRGTACIEAMLNRLDEPYIVGLQMNRREEFSSFINLI